MEFFKELIIHHCVSVDSQNKNTGILTICAKILSSYNMQSTSLFYARLTSQKSDKLLQTVPHLGHCLQWEIYHQVHALFAVLHVSFSVQLLLLFVQDPAHDIQ